MCTCFLSGELSISIKLKVKCTLVQALRFFTGRTAHRGSRGIALTFDDHGTRRGWGFSVSPRLLFTPRKDPVPIVQEAGWAPGPVWTGAENLAPTGIQSPDRPARSQSLYRLRYPGHLLVYFIGKHLLTLSFPFFSLVSSLSFVLFRTLEPILDSYVKWLKGPTRILHSRRESNINNPVLWLQNSFTDFLRHKFDVCSHVTP